MSRCSAGSSGCTSAAGITDPAIKSRASTAKSPEFARSWPCARCTWRRFSRSGPDQPPLRGGNRFGLPMSLDVHGRPGSTQLAATIGRQGEELLWRRSVAASIVALLFGLIGACASVRRRPADFIIAARIPAFLPHSTPESLLADRLEAEIAVQGSPHGPLSPCSNSSGSSARTLPLVDDSATLGNPIRIDPVIERVVATIPVSDCRARASCERGRDLGMRR